MEYNTSRPQLLLKEYGRNVQKLVEHLKTIKDIDRRTAVASSLIGLMKQVTPSHKDNNSDNSQKLWDDLYIMSDYSLDLNGPFPMPEREVVEKKPQQLKYQNNNIKYKHYGNNVELLIEEIKKIEDEKERENAIIYLGRLMKSFYGSSNKDNAEDETILNQMSNLSEGKLKISLDKVQSEDLFEPLFKDKRKQSSDRQGGQGGQSKGKGSNRSRSNRRKNN